MWWEKPVELLGIFHFIPFLWKRLFFPRCTLSIIFPLKKVPFSFLALPFPHSPRPEDNWDSYLYSIHPSYQIEVVWECTASSKTWEGCSRSLYLPERFRWTPNHTKSWTYLWAYTWYICKSQEVETDPCLSWSALHTYRRVCLPFIFAINTELDILLVVTKA